MGSIQSVCVCGAGTMGSGIAQLCAQSGFQTLLYDVDAAMLDKASSSIKKNLELLLNKGKLSASLMKQTVAILNFVTSINDCKADLVIEAIIEREEAKVSLFKSLAKINSSNSILASNTSSLSITSIAENLESKERMVGLHFFNPAPLMKLVEIVKTKYNGQPVIELIANFVKQLGKTAVICKDAPGFIVNHTARPYYLESLRIIEDGYSDFETIDELLESSGFKMGPFKLMDLIGNDINYAVSCSVYDALGKPDRLKPSIIQKEKVEKMELGKKTGKGYYNY